MVVSEANALNDAPCVEASGGRHPSMVGIVLLLTTVVAAGWGSLRLTDPNKLPIRQVRIAGAFRHLSPGELQSLVVSHVQGGFFTVDVDAIRRALLADPWVEQVSVRRQWPDGLTVYVREHIAVARWGEKGLLNVEGEFFSPDKNTFPQHLTELNGPEGTRPQLLDRLRVLRVALSHAGRDVVKLSLSDRRAWSFELDDGLTVIVGRKDFGDRVRRFARVFPTALSSRIADIDRVDLRYTNGFAVRWKHANPKTQG